MRVNVLPTVDGGRHREGETCAEGLGKVLLNQVLKKMACQQKRARVVPKTQIMLLRPAPHLMEVIRPQAIRGWKSICNKEKAAELQKFKEVFYVKRGLEYLESGFTFGPKCRHILAEKAASVVIRSVWELWAFCK